MPFLCELCASFAYFAYFVVKIKQTQPNNSSMKFPKKSIKRILFSLLLLAIAVYSYNTLQIYLYSKQCHYVQSDVAIVLGAGSSNGKLSPVFKERVNHAILLYHSGVVNYLIFTGGYGESQSISDSEAARNYALTKGVPGENIFTEQSSTITYTNLVYAKEIMERQYFTSALLVSDPLHMKRSIKMAEKMGINARSSPTQTSLYRSLWPKFKSLMYEAFFYNTGIIIGQL